MGSIPEQKRLEDAVRENVVIYKMKDYISIFFNPCTMDD